MLAHMLDYLTDKLSRGCQAEPVSLEAKGLFVRERNERTSGGFCFEEQLLLPSCLVEFRTEDMDC